MDAYETLSVLGEGTYGVVLKARSRKTGKIVAIKKFKQTEDDDHVRKTSMREVRMLQQLRHPNVIGLEDVFRRDGKLYLVFEYAEHTILQLLECTNRGLPPRDVRRFMYQLLRGIEFCHSHNVIHRDVKPENVLIDGNGVLKVCDFGFARQMTAKGRYTDYVATRWYRAPELLVGDVCYGKPVDIWAIGCLFAELTDGQPLFPGESDLDQLCLIMQSCGPIPDRMVSIFEHSPLYRGISFPHSSIVYTLPERYHRESADWMEFLLSCLHTNPDDRLSCTELLALPYFTRDGFRDRFESEQRRLSELPMLLSSRRTSVNTSLQTVPAAVAESSPLKGSHSSPLGPADTKPAKNEPHRSSRQQETTIVPAAEAAFQTSDIHHHQNPLPMMKLDGTTSSSVVPLPRICPSMEKGSFSLSFAKHTRHEPPSPTVTTEATAPASKPSSASTDSIASQIVMHAHPTAPPPLPISPPESHLAELKQQITQPSSPPAPRERQSTTVMQNVLPMNDLAKQELLLASNAVGASPSAPTAEKEEQPDRPQRKLSGGAAPVAELDLASLLHPKANGADGKKGASDATGSRPPLAQHSPVLWRKSKVPTPKSTSFAEHLPNLLLPTIPYSGVSEGVGGSHLASRRPSQDPSTQPLLLPAKERRRSVSLDISTPRALPAVEDSKSQPKNHRGNHRIVSTTRKKSKPRHQPTQPTTGKRTPSTRSSSVNGPNSSAPRESDVDVVRHNPKAVASLAPSTNIGPSPPHQSRYSTNSVDSSPLSQLASTPTRSSQVAQLDTARMEAAHELDGGIPKKKPYQMSPVRPQLVPPHRGTAHAAEGGPYSTAALMALTALRQYGSTTTYSPASVYHVPHGNGRRPSKLRIPLKRGYGPEAPRRSKQRDGRRYSKEGVREADRASVNAGGGGKPPIAPASRNNGAYNSPYRQSPTTAMQGKSVNLTPRSEAAVMAAGQRGTRNSRKAKEAELIEKRVLRPSPAPHRHPPPDGPALERMPENIASSPKQSGAVLSQRAQNSPAMAASLIEHGDAEGLSR